MMPRFADLSNDLLVEALCLLVVLAALVFHLQSSFAHWRIRDVVGPSPIPVFGNFKGLLLKGTPVWLFLTNVYRRYGKERMIGLFTGAEPILLLRDVDLIRDVLVRDLSAFADHGLQETEKIEHFAGNLSLRKPVKWRQLRAKMSAVFTVERLKGMFPLLAQCGDHFVEHLEKVAEDGGIVNCGNLVSGYVASSTASCVFGLEVGRFDDKAGEFARNAGAVLMKRSLWMSLIEKLKFVAPRLHNLIGYHLADHRSVRYFTDTLLSVMEERQRAGEKRLDFVDLILDLEKHPEKVPGFELSRERLAGQAIDFLVTGFHPSSVTMCYALYELARDQLLQDRLRLEIKTVLQENNRLDYDTLDRIAYLDLVLKETVRKYPSVVYLTRRASRSYRFTGTKVVVSKGQLIWVPVHAINRDPCVYPDPDRFDPERFPAGEFESAHPTVHLAFGDGSRNCIGSQFGRAQTKLGLVRILQDYRVDLFEEKPARYTDKCGRFATSPDDIILKISRIDRD